MTQISFNTIAFRREKIFNNKLIFSIKEWGFDGIEIWYPHLQKCDKDAVLAEILKHNLKVSCLLTYLNPLKIYEGDKIEKEELENIINWCKLLNCRYIRIFAGGIPSKALNRKEMLLLVDSIVSLTNEVLKFKIVLLIETHHDSLTDNLENSIEFYKILPLKKQCLLDLANLLELSKNWLKCYEELIEFTPIMHVKNAWQIPNKSDNPFRKVHNKDFESNLPNLSEGIIDYSTIINPKVYSGLEWITFEWFGDNVAEIAKNELIYLKCLLKDEF